MVVTEGVMAVAGEDKAVAGTTEGVGVAEEEVTAGEETTTVEVSLLEHVMSLVSLHILSSHVLPPH